MTSVPPLLRGLLGSLLVLAGGFLVATIPSSAPVLRAATLAAARGTEAGRMLGLTMVLVGLALAASAWLSLCRHVATSAARDQADALGLVRFATVVWAAPLLLAPPLFSRDGWSYAAQGMLARHGLSPYDHGPAALVPGFWSLLHGQPAPIVQAVDPMWMETSTPYGPLPLFLGRLVAGVTGNPWMLVIAHRCFALAGLALLAWAVPRMARWTGANPALASAIVLASPLMLANGVAGLHNDLLMVGLMAAALVVAVERGWAWGAVLGGLAAAVKLPGGLVCVAVALVGLPPAAALWARLRRLGAVALVSLVTLFGLGAATGLGHGWIGALTVPGEVETPLSISTTVGRLLDALAAAAGLGLGPDALRDLLRTAGVLAALGVSAWVALRWPTADAAAAVRAAAVSGGLFVVLCPVVHLWYFLLLPPFLATLRLSRGATSALLALSVVLGLVAPLDSSLHGAYLAIVLGCMTVAVLVPVLLLTPRARDRIDRIASSRWLALR
ncbi:polyprenol phosphomannose-dependent alpha 1,6 mannosyltransferase MptB [Nocardioides sp. GY 10113]|uniref:polyprenol phosphomannose-dependent alpha 1,6 mannosyltransferase MptB n=1 Tax=Nocardioides sp. GY 10113 TaxID=2569761 RepID=UPI001458C406|nr:polyprenol phosphomannose-dependent alpha 1,6 mannosyltransferase MptB [Nocardioides sp. GY 10113]